MRKIFIALAAALLITVSSAVQLNQLPAQRNAQGFLGLLETAVNVGDKVAQTVDPAVPTIALSNKGDVVTLKVAAKLAESNQWSLQNALKSSKAQTESGPLGLKILEAVVNDGDAIAQTLNPAIPTVKLSNVGDNVTLKVAAKLAETESEGIINAVETALGSAKVNLAVTDKVGQPPEVKGAVSFKLAQDSA